MNILAVVPEFSKLNASRTLVMLKNDESMPFNCTFPLERNCRAARSDLQNKQNRKKCYHSATTTSFHGFYSVFPCWDDKMSTPRSTALARNIGWFDTAFFMKTTLPPITDVYNYNSMKKKVFRIQSGSLR